MNLQSKKVYKIMKIIKTKFKDLIVVKQKIILISEEV